MMSRIPPACIATTFFAITFFAASSLVAATALGIDEASAQPATGAPAAMARVRDVMADRFRTEPLTGDPDRDFAALLAAANEELIFLAKAELEYGGDRHLRDLAQKIENDRQALLDDLKAWQVRSRETDYKAQPDQAPPGSGPLDRRTLQAAVAVKSAAAAPAHAPQPPPASDAPLVSGTVKKVDPAAGKVTLDHERIPNIDMEAMTMAYKVRSPAVLATLKPGDKVRFSAEMVGGQTLVTRIQPAR